ncbi:MAG: hypothetical protein H0V44_07845 [Planctomycetes bacterium]|nr:hypothetical protein [Planctomycetota bacterium]
MALISGTCFGASSVEKLIPDKATPEQKAAAARAIAANKVEIDKVDRTLSASQQEQQAFMAKVEANHKADRDSEKKAAASKKEFEALERASAELDKESSLEKPAEPDKNTPKTTSDAKAEVKADTKANTKVAPDSAAKDEEVLAPDAPARTSPAPSLGH